MSGGYEIRDRPVSLPPLRVKRKDSRAKLDYDKYAKSLFGLNKMLVTLGFVELMRELCGPSQRPSGADWRDQLARRLRPPEGDDLGSDAIPYLRMQDISANLDCVIRDKPARGACSMLLRGEGQL